jgi:hypothetical protein
MAGGDRPNYRQSLWLWRLWSIFRDGSEGAADVPACPIEDSFSLHLGYVTKNRHSVDIEMLRDLVEGGVDLMSGSVLDEEIKDLALTPGEGDFGHGERGPAVSWTGAGSD